MFSRHTTITPLTNSVMLMIWNHLNDVSTFRNFQIHVNISFEIPTKKKRHWKVMKSWCFSWMFSPWEGRRKGNATLKNTGGPSSERNNTIAACSWLLLFVVVRPRILYAAPKILQIYIYIYVYISIPSLTSKSSNWMKVNLGSPTNHKKNSWL